jgi:predicted nucleic acid-binding protein
VIPVTGPVARVHADIWSGLADRGEPIGAHDLWIAATSVARGLGIPTRNNSHFDRIPGLRVIYNTVLSRKSALSR